MKLFYLLVLLPTFALAGGNHHNPTVNNYNTTMDNSVTYENKYSGAAIGLASGSAICDSATRKNQLAIGVGAYDGSEAIFFRGCKSVGNYTINGGVGSEDGESGYSAGFSLKF